MCLVTYESLYDDGRTDKYYFRVVRGIDDPEKQRDEICRRVAREIAKLPGESNVRRGFLDGVIPIADIKEMDNQVLLYDLAESNDGQLA